MNIPKTSKILIIGGDLRQTHLFDIFVKKGYRVHSLHVPLLPDTFNNAFSYQILIFPIPFSKDGKNISTDAKLDFPVDCLNHLINNDTIIIGGKFTTDFLSHNNLAAKKIIDLTDLETFSTENAVATAEAAISKAILNSSVNLCHENALVLGYGKCGRAIASRLCALSANTYVAARNTNSRLLAGSYGNNTLELTKLKSVIGKCPFIFNTIPAMILTDDVLCLAQKHATIIDIASSPGGTDFNACQKYQLNASLCLSLPGKYSPKSSAYIIYKCLEEYNEN